MTTDIKDTAGMDCLLVVDADKETTRTLDAMLGKVGFEILPAADGAQALKALTVRRPDLILLNLHLPDMDGFALCRKIIDTPQWTDIPIIFLSSDEDKKLVVRALESGGVDYITKPFHQQELLSRIRTHLMLKTSRDHARRLAQDRDEMLGMISHHLQNHLVGMNMSAQLLLDRAQNSVDPKLRLMAENIRSSSGQMRAFVKGFLANAASDHGLQIKLEPVDFNKAVRAIVKQYEDVARLKGIHLQLKLDEGQGTVKADLAALEQTLDNLISNAIKFSPPGKEVLITVQPASAHLEFQVVNEGAGFTAEDKLRMFGRYARLSTRPTGGEPSTGLGLSIVKKLVHAMNGELLCESVPGKSATFIVRLPLFPAAEQVEISAEATLN